MTNDCRKLFFFAILPNENDDLNSAPPNAVERGTNVYTCSVQ